MNRDLQLGAVRRGRSVALAAIGAWTVAGMLLATGPSSAARRDDARRHSRRHDDERRRTAGEDFHWSWRIPAGKTIEIKGVNGGIHARAASGDEVEVTATKHWRRSDPEQVKIEIIEHRGGVTVCAVYPGPRGRPNKCEPGSSTHSHVDNNDVEVEFEVAVPSGVGFMGRTVNGEIEAEHIAGPVEACTVNGSIRIASRDMARASTVNGSIVAKVGSPSWEGELGFSTVNGGITLDFPEDLSADVRAETLNGEISSDFDLTVKGRLSPRRLTGTVGRGGGELALSTVNGDIRIQSSR